MISEKDFEKKQILLVFFNEGDKIAFKNDNVIVKDKEGKIKIQMTCYRLFLIFAVGSFSITTVVVQKAKKFGFSIALLTASFRIYDMIGFQKDGNTMLRKKQYEYEKLEIAKRIVENKIETERIMLLQIRKKNVLQREAIGKLEEYIYQVKGAEELNKLMAYEGLAAKLYFKNFFDNVCWIGRKPRIKKDYINSTLDIGYTILFSFIEALLIAYGFDLYCGVLHREFYMRKSLVCDLVEPFRCIIDKQVKKGINLRQIKEEDFVVINHQYRLKWEKSSEYVALFVKCILEEKENIFLYIQSYYRAFMKQKNIQEYPFYGGSEIDNS